MCISLMNNDFGHLYMCLSIIYISSLIKYPYFSHLYWAVCFPLLIVKNYIVNIKCVYIQNINTLLVIYLTLVIYKILQVSFEEQKLFIVMMSKFSPFLLRMCFWYHMLKKNNHLIQRHLGFLLYTLLEVLYV